MQVVSRNVVQVPWLLGTALLALMAGAPCAALELSAEPAWGGYTRSGAATEVNFRILTRQGEAARLALVDGPMEYRIDVRPQPDRPLLGRLPVAPSDRDQFEMMLWLDDAPPVRRTVPFHRLRQGVPVVAVAAEVALPAAFPAQVVYVPTDALPRYLASYQVVDVLVIDGPGVAQLDPEQRHAMQRRLLDCGRLVMVGLTDAAADALAGRVGCAGRSVLRTSAAQVQVSVAELLALPDPGLPTPGQLRDLLSNQATRGIAPIAALMIGYLALGLVAIRRLAVAHVVLLSVVAGLLGIVLWWGGRAELTEVVWAEIHDGDPAARYVALTRLRGAGSGWSSVASAAIDGPLIPLQPTEAVIRHATDDSARTVRVNQHLLERVDFVHMGVLRWPAPLALNLSGGRPRVTNRSRKASQAALLRWDEHSYLVPALAPGEEWVPQVPARSKSGGIVPQAVAQLFDARSVHDDAALLIAQTERAGEGSGSQPEPARVQRYLMVRP